jgi:hypothetical protein
MLKLWKKLIRRKQQKQDLDRCLMREKMVKGFPISSNWFLGNFEVLDYKLIELYKEKGYFGKLPWISELEQRAISFHWKNEMRERGWDCKKSIYEKQDLFDNDCERCLNNAIDIVLN